MFSFISKSACVDACTQARHRSRGRAHGADPSTPQGGWRGAHEQAGRLAGLCSASGRRTRCPAPERCETCSETCSAHARSPSALRGSAAAVRRGVTGTRPATVRLERGACNSAGAHQRHPCSARRRRRLHHARLLLRAPCRALVERCVGRWPVAVCLRARAVLCCKPARRSACRGGVCRSESPESPKASGDQGS